MKTLNTIVLACSAAAVLGGSGLYAQLGTVAKIPFDFTVQTVTLPAGEYALQRVTQTSDVIRIQKVAARHFALVIASKTLSKYKGNQKGEGKLIFHRYGDRYFFAEVWSLNGGPCGAVNSSQLERELQVNGAGQQMALVSIPLAGAGQ